MQFAPAWRGRGFRPAVRPNIQSRPVDLRYHGNTSFGDAVGLQAAPRELSGQPLPAPDHTVQSNVLKLLYFVVAKKKKTVTIRRSEVVIRGPADGESMIIRGHCVLLSKINRKKKYNFSKRYFRGPFFVGEGPRIFVLRHLCVRNFCN